MDCPVSNDTMDSHARSSDRERLSEWASLTGEVLPEEYAPSDED